MPSLEDTISRVNQRQVQELQRSMSVIAWAKEHHMVGLDWLVNEDGSIQAPYNYISGNTEAKLVAQYVKVRYIGESFKVIIENVLEDETITIYLQQSHIVALLKMIEYRVMSARNGTYIGSKDEGEQWQNLNT